MRCVRLRITGRVQGVGYRAWVLATADRLGLRGWVRNRTDGSVEAVLLGEESAVAAMIAACHDGPPAARVRDVATSDAPQGDIGDGFEARPTV